MKRDNAAQRQVCAKAAYDQLWCAIATHFNKSSEQGDVSRVPLDEIRKVFRGRPVQESWCLKSAVIQNSIDFEVPCALVVKLEDGRYWHLLFCNCQRAKTVTAENTPPDSNRYFLLLNEQKR